MEITEMTLEEFRTNEKYIIFCFDNFGAIMY